MSSEQVCCVPSERGGGGGSRLFAPGCPPLAESAHETIDQPLIRGHQVHPLRIAKGATPKSSPTKMASGLPRPLSELSPTERRRNSPSWHHMVSPKVRGMLLLPVQPILFSHAHLTRLRSRRRPHLAMIPPHSSRRPSTAAPPHVTSGRTATRKTCPTVEAIPPLPRHHNAAPRLRSCRELPESRTATS